MGFDSRALWETSPMSLVVIGAAVTFAIVLVLIVRELRAQPSVRLAAPAGSLGTGIPSDEELDITRVANRPKKPSLRPAVPQIAVTEDDGGGSPSITSALTLYQSESNIGVDEPTGPHQLIVVHSVGQTDRGKRRKRNEDAYLVMPWYGLYVVADGMGGYAGGDVASRLAVDSIRRDFLSSTFNGEPDERRPRRGNELVWAIEAANREIFAKAQSEPTYDGMGTTLVAARFSPRKQRVYIGHVGDSRCYRRRDGVLSQLTTDHTLGSMGVTGPFAAHLRRALGIRDHVKVDLIVDKPRPGDLYLLCSDGLSKMVPDRVINEIVGRGKDLDATVAELVERANESGGRDNITVVLLSVLPPSGAPRSTGKSTKRSYREVS